MANINNGDKLIKIDDSTYPVYLYQIRTQLQNVSLPSSPTEEQLLPLGYAKVVTTTPPVGDVVTESAPTLADGIYTQAWAVRAYTTDELASQLTQKKAELNTQLDSYRAALLNAGVEYDFGDPDGLQHIQVRDGDRANLAGIRIKANERVAANDQTTELFRTQENNNISLTPTQFVALTDAAFNGYYGILGTVWALQAQIDGAADIESLPTVPQA